MTDLIAYLLPFQDGHRGHADRAVTSPRNMSRYFACNEQPFDNVSRHSRESTRPIDSNEDTTGCPSMHGLQLKFSLRPKPGPGFVLGTDPNACDIVLPRLAGISRRHCYLTFDTERRLILRDCSSNGTIVRYDGTGGQSRHDFTWIVGDPGAGRDMGQVVVQIHQHLKFQIMASQPPSLEIFFTNVDLFMAETDAGADLPLAALGIQSSGSTAVPSGLQAPRTDPILLVCQELGRGNSSLVHLVRDVSSDAKYASKTFLHARNSRWKSEALLLRQISHEYIVKLCFERSEPHPQLMFEYLPLGNLRDQQSISGNETVQILPQALSALTYLHERVPPIVHGHIEPSNILVRNREPLWIKLADFGTSKDEDYLFKFCAVRRYCAPEIFSNLNQEGHATYTLAGDIWSLGVVGYEYMYELPARGRLEGLSWCEKLVRALRDIDPDACTSLITQMISPNPRARGSARDCWNLARALDCLDRSSTPTQAAYQDIFTSSLKPRDSSASTAYPRSNLKRGRSSDVSPCPRRFPGSTTPGRSVHYAESAISAQHLARGFVEHEQGTHIDVAPAFSTSTTVAHGIGEPFPQIEGSNSVSGRRALSAKSSTDGLESNEQEKREICHHGENMATSGVPSSRAELQQYDETTVSSEYLRFVLGEFLRDPAPAQICGNQEARQATSSQFESLPSPRAEVDQSDSDFSFQTCSSGANEDYPVTFDTHLRDMFYRLSGSHSSWM